MLGYVVFVLLVLAGTSPQTTRANFVGAGIGPNSTANASYVNSFSFLIRFVVPLDSFYRELAHYSLLD